MKKIVYGSKMKKVDNYTMDVLGIPSMVLMERAAFSVFLYMNEHIDQVKKILCVCGTGNNGADGIALARMLCLSGYKAEVLYIGDENKATNQWKEQKNIAINCDLQIESAEDLQVTLDKNETYNSIRDIIKERLYGYDFIVDAIFGIGLTRNVEGLYADFIESINEQRKNDKVKVYALDVPSGLCADTGKVMGTAIEADMTFTFGAMKTGLLLYKGKDFAGEIVINDIGFPEKAYMKGLEKSECCKTVDEADLNAMTARKRHSNKGSYGKILIIGGSEKVYGAVYFSAMAACKLGCGLIRVITHENNRNLIYNKLPEAMINVYGTDESEESIVKMIDEAVAWADVIVIGPGLSKNNVAELLLKHAMRSVKYADKSIIIDADGLNIIAEKPELLEYYHRKTIITPHIGEAARLFGENTATIAGDIIKVAGSYAHEHNINVIQKDSTTVILGIESSEDKCNNRVCINTSGNAGMATGGSGDILTGIVAAVLAGGIDVTKMQEYQDAFDKEGEKIFLAASVAVYIHGLAGDMAAEEMGETSMTATDILNKIPKVLNKILK